MTETIKGVVIHPERRYQITLVRAARSTILGRDLSARINERHGVSGAVVLELADVVNTIREDPTPDA